MLDLPKPLQDNNIEWGHVLTGVSAIAGVAMAAFGAPGVAMFGARIAGMASAYGVKDIASTMSQNAGEGELKWNSAPARIAGVAAAIAAFAVASPLATSALVGIAGTVLVETIWEIFADKQADPNINAQTAHREGTVASSPEVLQHAAR